ncbi:MAG: WD40 repeat domain-containing protein [Spirochaetales bacterium]|nr:WD40 repeat domain-containing protein [Spirochaetales bacterium]
MKKILTALIFSLLAFNAAGATKFVINRGHFSPIVDIRYDEKRDLIFSAEQRGAVSVWNASEETLRNHFQITSNTIDQLLISPEDNNVAVLSHDAEKYYLSVWNWATEKQIFTRKIDEQPLFLEYSATGRYLFYGNVNNPSLTFLNARNGVQLNYMEMLPSIYDFGYLGTTESNLMTYSSSGSIRFYDFRTSREIKAVSTVDGLTNLNVIQTEKKALMSALKSNRIYLIERLTGTSVDSKSFQELRSFFQNRENGLALTLERANRSFILKKWSTDNNNYSELENPIILTSAFNITSLVETGTLTLVGDDKGALYKADWEAGRLIPFSVDITETISDLSISGNILTLAAEKGLISIEAPFFTGSLSTNVSPVFEKKENPLGEDTGFLALEDGSTLLWNKGNDKPAILIQNIEDEPLFEYSDFSSPIQDITYQDGNIITLERNGTIKIINREQGNQIFSYSAIGLQDISMVDNRTLFAGRASTAGKSPAITIDIRTKETLTVEDNRFLIFDSIAVEKNDQFFSLGLLEEDGKTKTVLRRHNYNNLNESETILIYTGEDIKAQVLIDPSDSRTIYAKLGTSGIYKITGRNVTKYENNKPVKKIYLSGSILYSLNEDNSISMFRASSGQQLYSIHIFKDDSWALIPASSDIYFGSEGVEDKIISYRSGRRIDLKPLNGG